MKKKLYQAVLLLSMNCVLIQAINPAEDFRTPETLQSILHERLCAISDSLEVMIDASSNRSLDLTQIKQELSSLTSMYEQTVDTTRNNSIYDGDKQYLESLIDRIDNMIMALEGNSSDDQDQDVAVQEDIDSVRSLCSEFKGKLYQR